MDLNNFIEDLSSNSPAPGGGAASAVFGMLGTALTSMVCALTEGREKYSEYEDEVRQKHEQILELQKKFAEAKEADIAAFNQISAAYKMPKETDEEVAARSAAIQEALVPATQAPLNIMKMAGEGLDITASLIGKTNVMAKSDLGCAALGLKSAMQGAYLNVQINLNSAKNPDEKIASEAKNLLEKYIPIADEIYSKS